MQTRRGSITEVLANTTVGWLINFGANMLILPLFFTGVSAADAAGIGVIFTALAVIRGFAIRRWFDGLKFGHTGEAK